MREVFGRLVAAFVIGLCMNLDASPMRVFGLDGVAGCQDVLVKSVRVVAGDGPITPLAPGAFLPCKLGACAHLSNV